MRGIPEKVQRATSDTMKLPTCQSLRTPSGLKSQRRLDQLWGWCPLVLESVARQFWGWSPLREVPACESTPWSQLSNDAAGTSTSTVRLAVPGTSPSPARDAGSHGSETPPRHHDPLASSCGAQYLFGLYSTCSLSTRELLDPVSLKDTLRPEAPVSSR